MTQVDGTALAMENILSQLGLLSVMIQALGKGTFKFVVDELTLSAFTSREGYSKNYFIKMW